MVVLAGGSSSTPLGRGMRSTSRFLTTWVARRTQNVRTSIKMGRYGLALVIAVYTLVKVLVHAATFVV